MSNTISQPVIRRGFTSGRPTKCWEEALPSGNGKMGALMMGQPANETIILSHEKLFMPIYGRWQCPNVSDSLPELRRLLKERLYKEAWDFEAKVAVDRGIRIDRDFRGRDPFHKAFDLRLTMPSKGKVYDYLRWVNFESGEAGTLWNNEQGNFCRRLFVSRSDNVVVLSICSTNGKKINCQLQLTPGQNQKEKEYIRERIRSLTMKDQTEEEWISSLKIATENEWISYQAYYGNSVRGYEGLARIICPGGTVDNDGQTINIKDANEVLVFARVMPVADMNKSGLKSARKDLVNLEADYDKLLGRHVKIHGEIFNRVTLDLGGGQDRNLTIEQLLFMANEGNLPMALLEKAHDMGRYVFISSSGELPPNIQGVWTGFNYSIWWGEYQLDAQLQFAVSPALPGNMAECLEGYFKYIESLLPDWRENARLVFGCRGVLGGFTSTTHGQTGPGLCWTASAGWLAQPFYEYWLFTGDRDFLAKRAVPLMKEVATFYEDFLVEDENGKYIFSPSISPENTPANSDVPICTNATMDIAVTKELLSNLVTAYEELNIDPEDAAKWKKMLEKLPEYMVNKDGSLKEWAVPDLDDNNTCYHSSHFYPLWPGYEAQPDRTPELFKACKKAVQNRIAGQKATAEQGREKGNVGRGWLEFTVAWATMAAARLKDGELAFDCLSELVSQFCFSNLMGAFCHVGNIYAENYPHNGRLVNIDANGGIPSALMEMLVFSCPGFVELLPALPSKLSKGSAGGILCRGGIKVERIEWDMKAKTLNATLKSVRAQTIELKVHKETKSLEILQGRTAVKKSTAKPLYYKLVFPAATSVKLAIAFK